MNWFRRWRTRRLIKKLCRKHHICWVHFIPLVFHSGWYDQKPWWDCEECARVNRQKQLDWTGLQSREKATAQLAAIELAKQLDRSMADA